MTLRAHAGRLVVHQIAAQVARDAADLARTFRGPGAPARGDQLVQTACAVVARISQACGRATVGEFRQEIIYARGAAHEMRGLLHVARLLDPGIARRCEGLESRVTLTIKMLGRLHDHPPQ
jgi:four helix bundle protein